jgi:hypothetical protein
MWTIVIAVCYAPMVVPMPPRCQVLTPNAVVYHLSKDECLATADTHQQALAQELARQGLRMVQFGVRCDQVGDPA